MEKRTTLSQYSRKNYFSPEYLEESKKAIKEDEQEIQLRKIKYDLEEFLWEEDLLKKKKKRS